MNYSTLALFALAIGPAIAVMAYVYSRDKNEREPVGVLLVSFFWGCFSVVPAIILESILPPFLPANMEGNTLSIAIYAFAIIAFSEEFSKFIFLRYYSYKKRSFNEPFDGIIYAIMVGMGFATIENLLYIFGADTPGASFGVAGVRAISAVPAHATFAAIMGYYVGLAKFSRKNEKRLFWQGILLATFFHGLYDFFLFQNLSIGLYIGAIISLIVGIRFSMKAMKLHKMNSPFNRIIVENIITTEKPKIKLDDLHDIDDDHFESPYKPR